jgi:hypothetical protein
LNRADPSPQALTLDTLVHYGPLTGTTALIERYFDQPVPNVALVSELDQIRKCAAHTAVVLHSSVAHGVWAVESAMRLAWERAASCVVTPAVPGLGESTVQLALRLRIPVFVVSEDSAQCALDLAAAIINPDAVRAKLIARCAVLFGERTSMREILGVINAEVPGVTAALVRQGQVLAGRSSVVQSGPERVRMEVPSPDGHPWATLVAEVAGGGDALLDTVRTILQLARAPLMASVARQRLELVHNSAQASTALDALLGSRSHRESAPEPDETVATQMGWHIAGRHVAVFLRPANEGGLDVATATPGVVAVWQRVFGERPLVPRAEGWASWWSAEDVTAAEVARQLRLGLAQMHAPMPLVAGVGDPGEQVSGLRESLMQAELASTAARGNADTCVEQFAELGERLMLACLPLERLERSARVALDRLRTASDHRTLVTTLAAVLDHGGSTSRAAAYLGVHRNTVLGRLERIRAYGVDIDRAESRLGLHLAVYALSVRG